MIMTRTVTIIFIICALFSGGCVTTGSKTPAEKRQATLSMKNEVLSDLYKLKPDVKSQISSAAGYAVFSDANINIIFASFGGGYGVVHNNKTDKLTFMKMGEVGAGFGLGVKDFRVVFIFHTTDSMDRFVEHGWAVGVQADAAAKAGEKGIAVSREVTVDNITIYQLTKSGLALQATIKGTKYWRYNSLN